MFARYLRTANSKLNHNIRNFKVIKNKIADGFSNQLYWIMYEKAAAKDLYIRRIIMPVMEKSGIALPPKARNLPVVEYPPEVVERWDREFEITKMQLATGEFGPRTIAEAAAELGISLDDQVHRHSLEIFFQ